MNVSGTSITPTSIYPLSPISPKSASETSSNVAAPAVTDVVFLSSSIPTASAASNTSQTVTSINERIDVANDDAMWAMIAKHGGAAGAAAGRAAFAQMTEGAEKAITADSVGLSAADFAPLDADDTGAVSASNDANAAAGAAESITAVHGTDPGAYTALLVSSIAASTTTTSNPTGSDSAAAPTVSESNVAAADALRMLERITQSKAESPDILKSATAMLDSYV